MKKKFAIGEGTVIGLGTTVNGPITSDATMIRIDGTVNGDVDTKGVITVGKDGTVNGNVTGESLILAGSVLGNVKVNDKVEIHSKGKLIGDVDTKGITIDDDAIFKGNCKMEVETSEATTISDDEKGKEEADKEEEKPCEESSSESDSNNNNNNNNKKKKKK